MKEKDITYKLNSIRINYLLNLYSLSRDEFIELIHLKRKRKIFTDHQLDCALDDKAFVTLQVLKLIDKTFKKGLTWYISKRDLPDPKKSSIFFRKDTFNTESKLDFESKKVVNNYEELKIEIQTLCKFINLDLKRLLKTYNVKHNPQQAAHEVRTNFNKIEQSLIKEKIISPSNNERDFLKNSIRILEELNIFVFEFTETWNKINKASFNGFHISPNIIVIKRQEYERREIFTLFHEFAHYLLNYEEIDWVSENEYTSKNRIEKWCHSFAFYFLLDTYKIVFSELSKATIENNFHKSFLDKLYHNTYLSYSALYTLLRIDNKISQEDYDNKLEKIRLILAQRALEKKEKAKLEREIAEEQGKKIIAFQKPIESKLFKEIVKINYFEGNINESRLRDYLHISDKKSIDSVIY
ncbi:MAG: ImmA/IrrE family metallo-endopeptidase, partial [Candidatus Cloacimonetes bacterium]|nr:ImmA/IrrE family metallo-endopeptidase [Candidatus Cloacimonadota bacterium]